MDKVPTITIPSALFFDLMDERAKVVAVRSVLKANAFDSLKAIRSILEESEDVRLGARKKPRHSTRENKSKQYICNS